MNQAEPVPASPAEPRDALGSLRTGWAALTLAAAGYAVSEIVLAFGAHEGGKLKLVGIPFSAYAAGVYLAMVFAVLAHTLPGWLLLRCLPSARARAYGATGLAAALAVAWQETVAHGDGLVARPDYAWVRVGLVVGAALGGAFFTRLLLVPSRVPPRVRTALVAVALVGAVVFDHQVLRSYREFHGYLTAVTIVGIAWLGAPLARPAAMQLIAAALLAGGFALAGAHASDLVPMEGHLRRFSPLAGNILRGLPLTKAPVFTPEAIVDPGRRLSAAEAARAKEAQARFASELGTEPKGENVIVIVLESTRADAWADPRVTPAFHRWKSHGLHVPRAVSQYPATPLAYAALFASLPPSVVVSHPFWARKTLTSALRRKFDSWILSQPDSYWFRTSSISRFVTPSDGVKVYAHADTNEGLTRFWKDISRVPNSKSFFGWIHLYDPHDPYTHHKEFKFGVGKRARYRSEVAHLDRELGQFMEWFYASRLAKNTLLVVIGDHGEGLGEAIDGQPFWGHHVQVHSAVSHVPFFASGPGIPEGETRTDLHVAQMDLMPTVFDFLGEPLPDGAMTEGRSLYAELDAPAERPLVTEAFSIRGAEFFALFEMAHRPDADPAELHRLMAKVNAMPKYPPKLGMELGRYKLVRDLLIRRSALYDLTADPAEQRDLSAVRPADLRRLEAAFDAWRAEQTWIIQEAERRDAVSGAPAKKGAAMRKTAKIAGPSAGRAPSTRP